ncbi:hypothetical protein Vadar_013529 [Vaccinium darrowii]|uniref:Uncharacterized protein n=1 Tax=Vaccinium darrowii TaxID=229202 RepID=A0ACB7ZCF3_9ERIC|nr:hypothetical protein Vadar_013529 [Vaccinium darrowii]
MGSVHRRVFPEKPPKSGERGGFLGYRHVRMYGGSVQGAADERCEHGLSVMAYDYPAEKLSVYVSDDGGSDLTLFAFMEAAKFGSHWLPFCRRNKVVERSPEAYFGLNYPDSNKTKQIKVCKCGVSMSSRY